MKCPNPKHTKNVKYVCFDDTCKEQRLYCHECIKIGMHVTHLQHQEELQSLFEHISTIEKESDDLINTINKQMDLIQNDFFLLIGGIRTKYQISKQLPNLNSQQINSFLTQSIHFKQFQLIFENLLQQFIKEFQDQIKKLQNDLNLFALDYYQISKPNIEKSEELYKIGYKLYWNDDKYDEAIKIFDQALNFNPKHQLSLSTKAESLRNLGQYNEAIIWADKALQADPKHCRSLFTKAESLRKLGQYNEAIFGLIKLCKQIQSNSLRQLKKFKEAMEVIEQSLIINPNHFNSLRIKGQCLHDQKQYLQALIFYDKALEIDSNHKWTKKRKNECLEAIQTQ
ncbi:unnamed protein product [Paramecium octaurelia]|uniref:Tetratricopeptide repeat protein n=1 Tax=Paramecium octaurelia TaxID=43137 RepID=A0A8S1YRW1_PAROT|nr:unnamed protein product [Paramecium octaurelia]